ncbi:hypothetical protein D3C73_1434570 [compost metagenome]
MVRSSHYRLQLQDAAYVLSVPRLSGKAAKLCISPLECGSMDGSNLLSFGPAQMDAACGLPLPGCGAGRLLPADRADRQEEA